MKKQPLKKERLTNKEIELIGVHVMLKKRVAAFRKESGVPIHAYYAAFNGANVKVEHIKNIRKTLKQFINQA